MNKKYLLASVAAFLTVGISVASAQENTTYYSGEYVCDNDQRYTDWKLTKLNDSEYSASIYYGVIGASRYTGHETTAFEENGKLIVLDGRRPLIVADLTEGDDAMEAVWLNRDGKPQANCSSFKLTPQVSAKDRWDELFEIFSVEKPTVTEATEAVKRQTTLPTARLLPDLDQNTYEVRYAKEARDFWTSYFANQNERLLTLPIGTEEERIELNKEMRLATSWDMSPTGSLTRDDTARRQAAHFLRITTDRLASTSNPVTPLSFDTACERFAYHNYPSTDEIELMVGLPTDYWDRGLAEVVIQKAQQCGNDNIASEIKRSYPDYEQGQKSREWAMAEVERLQSLPQTIATLKETNWFTVSNEAARANGLDRNAYDRFFTRLDKSREERFSTAIEEIEKSFDTDIETMSFKDASKFCVETLGQRPSRAPEALVNLFEACDTAADNYIKSSEDALVEAQIEAINNAPRNLEGLIANNGFALNATVAEGWVPSHQANKKFENRVAASLREALKVAKTEITDLFDKAATDEASEAKVTELCEGLTSNRLSQELSAACQEGANALNKKREAIQCEQTIKDSGIEPSLLDASILQPEAISQQVGVRELICRSAKSNVGVTFPKSGALLWKKQGIELKADNPEVWSITADLEKTDKENVYKLTNVKRVGPDNLPSENKVLACLAGKDRCE